VSLVSFEISREIHRVAREGDLTHEEEAGYVAAVLVEVAAGRSLDERNPIAAAAARAARGEVEGCALTQAEVVSALARHLYYAAGDWVRDERETTGGA
jgi:hypothetical protein